MNHSNVRDLTAKQPAPGLGMDIRLLYLCGCKGQRTGGIFRGRMPMLCPKCAGAK